MINTQKYTSLVDFSTKLNSSIQKFDTVMWSKTPRQMGSFKVTMRNIIEIVHNMIEIHNMLDVMSKLTTLDSEAIQYNISAKKAANQINLIKLELVRHYDKLKKDFFKQMDIAGKQCYNISIAIKDEEERESFKKASKDFKIMVYETKAEKFIIPLNEKNNLKHSQQNSEHVEQEKEINSSISTELLRVNKLESALNLLTTILILTPSDDLSKKIEKEVAQIKKALPPKTISVTKDTLEYLRHSSHLLLDLEQISEIMNTTNRFMGSDGKLQKINKKLNAVKQLLKKAIKDEEEIKDDMEQEYDDVQSRIDYATKAATTYGDIIDGNTKLQEEQEQIRNHTHELYAENSRLEDEEKKSTFEAQRIKIKPISEHDENDEARIEDLYKTARYDRNIINNNKLYLSDKMSEKVVTELPSEYTKMKKRLQNVSSLYYFETTQELLKRGKVK